jgi:SAM-dependent methyltransferase
MAEANNYYRWILDNFSPHLGKRIVEIGAGIGTFAEHLLTRAPASELLLLEPADNNFPLLRERFADSPRVRTAHAYIGQLEPRSADTLIAVNVMEHVEDDDGFLRAAHRSLDADGKLLLFVPALPQIFGTLDEAFEHFRRYTHSGLLAQLRRTGFHARRLSYMNFPGVLAWWMSGKVLRRRTVTSQSALLYDRWIVPWVAELERRWTPPFGQSLLAVATPTRESGT